MSLTKENNFFKLNKKVVNHIYKSLEAITSLKTFHIESSVFNEYPKEFIGKTIKNSKELTYLQIELKEHSDNFFNYIPWN